MQVFILAAAAIIAVAVLIGGWLRLRAERETPPPNGLIFDLPRPPRERAPGAGGFGGYDDAA